MERAQRLCSCLSHSAPIFTFLNVSGKRQAHIRELTHPCNIKRQLRSHARTMAYNVTCADTRYI